MIICNIPHSSTLITKNVRARAQKVVEGEASTTTQIMNDDNNNPQGGLYELAQT